MIRQCKVVRHIRMICDRKQEQHIPFCDICNITLCWFNRSSRHQTKRLVYPDNMVWLGPMSSCGSPPSFKLFLRSNSMRSGASWAILDELDAMAKLAWESIRLPWLRGINRKPALETPSERREVLSIKPLRF
jgi:hypothetical protein